MNPSARRRILLLTVVMWAVGVAIPLAWVLTRPESDVGSVAAFEAGRRKVPPEPVVASERVRTRSARIEDAPVGAATPLRVRVPSIGVDAPVVPVGLATDRSMEIPASVDTVGWYRLGSVPGREGSAVLAGHVDSRSQGPGAFFRLRDLQPGAEIAVADARNVEHRFRVVARRQIGKAELPADLFATNGAPRLALVTCGGEFDRTSRSYRDNIVIYAVAT